LKPEEFETSASFPAADIKAQNDGEDMHINHSYPVVTPDIDKNEFMVTIRASSLRAWQNKLSKLKSKLFPWAEILLAASSLCLGAILSAIVSDISISTTKGKFFYVILPPLAAAAIVAYFFVRHTENLSTSVIAETLLDEMPNINGSKGGKNEFK